MTMQRISRRRLTGLSGLSLLGASLSGWLPRLAAQVQQSGQRPGRSCILLWMSGGPSQMETFDPHPGHENGGPTKSIETSVPGIRIAEHLPKLASQMQDLALIRSMTTKEGDHTRATYYLRTGYLPQGPLTYPALGSLVGRALQVEGADLPACISINPFRALSPAAFTAGFLGPAWSPLVVASDTNADGDVSFQVRNLKPAARLSGGQVDERLRLLGVLEQSFLADRPDAPGRSHLQSYERAVRMMRSESVEAFQLEQEDEVLREAYGRNPFGQGCLLARRLVERGVPFVEVSLSGLAGEAGPGWDTHADNFKAVGDLCGVLDPAWSTLLTDLRQRGLLENTLVIWMGEFGRTPKINDNFGRDHWPGSWSAVLGGGGIRGGQVWGSVSEDGMEVRENPVRVPDLMATICRALGLDPAATNLSSIGRPIPLADHGAVAIEQLLV